MIATRLGKLELDFFVHTITSQCSCVGNNFPLSLEASECLLRSKVRVLRSRQVVSKTKDWAEAIGMGLGNPFLRPTGSTGNQRSKTQPVSL